MGHASARALGHTFASRFSHVKCKLKFRRLYAAGLHLKFIHDYDCHRKNVKKIKAIEQICIFYLY